MILYGIPTCETCRKALAALRATGRDVAFRNIRQTPLDAAEIDRFIGLFGDRIVNRASTTWRNFTEAEREISAETLLHRHPTLMKRPVIADGDRITLGWDKAVQALWL